MKFIISPWSRSLRNGQKNPKNYPFWSDLILHLNCSGNETIQIGISGEIGLPCTHHALDLHVNDLKKLIDMTDSWISVDNFFPHMVHCHSKKPGICIFGRSHPAIFGYQENLNLAKSMNNFREHQFGLWEDVPYDETIFPPPKDVFHVIQQRYPEILSTMVLDLSQIN